MNDAFVIGPGREFVQSAGKERQTTTSQLWSGVALRAFRWAAVDWQGFDVAPPVGFISNGNAYRTIRVRAEVFDGSDNVIQWKEERVTFPAWIDPNSSPASLVPEVLGQFNWTTGFVNPTSFEYLPPTGTATEIHYKRAHNNTAHIYYENPVSFSLLVDEILAALASIPFPTIPIPDPDGTDLEGRRRVEDWNYQDGNLIDAGTSAADPYTQLEAYLLAHAGQGFNEIPFQSVHGVGAPGYLVEARKVQFDPGQMRSWSVSGNTGIGVRRINDPFVELECLPAASYPNGVILPPDSSVIMTDPGDKLERTFARFVFPPNVGDSLMHPSCFTF